MKHLILLFFLLFNASYFAQVIISPYVVYIDAQERYGTFIVQNESNQDYEITISFVFGHPISDSLGNVSMKYYEEPVNDLPSITNWIRAFPKKFVLMPGQRQLIRMTVRPPDTLTAGTYWTRIVTSSAPKADSLSTASSEISAKINFVLNQVTTVLYRVDPADTKLIVKDFRNDIDTSSLDFYVTLKREGNSPYWGDLFITIEDSLGSIIKEQQEYLPVYFELVKKYSFNLNEIPSGNYTARMRFEFNEKEDIPKSRIDLKPAIIKTLSFEVP
jgi:P pilus assembly chaperone PapD